MDTVEQTDNKTIGIIGGGMLGLTVALHLAKAGHKVTVLEAAPEIGGLTSSSTVGGFFCDTYYHVTLLSDTKLRQLLDELGLEKDMQWKVTKTQFYDGDKVHSLNNAIDFLTLPVISLIGKIRLAFTIVYASMINDGKRLEKESAETWLVRLSGKRTYENLWKPLLKAKLGDNYNKVSAAFIWSVIRRFYAARRTGLKTEMFGYLPGGYARIIKALVGKLESLGVTIETGAPVTKVVKTDGQFRLTTTNSAHTFDKLVATFSSHHIAKVFTDLSEEERSKHESLTYQGIVCVKMAISRSLGGAYLTYVRDHRVPFTAIIEMSSLVDFGVDGRHLIYLPKYVASDSPDLKLDDSEIVTEFIQGLKLMFADFTDDMVIDYEVTRTPYVVSLSTLNYSENMPPMVSSDKDLFAINSAQINNAALSVNETVTLAEQGAQCVLRNLQHD